MFIVTPVIVDALVLFGEACQTKPVEWLIYVFLPQPANVLSLIAQSRWTRKLGLTYSASTAADKKLVF